jgi:predicted site-specific integrase-resolvase
MNFTRKQFMSIVERIERGEIAKLLIAHKDRLYGMRKYKLAVKEDFPLYKLSPQKDELQ